jgi:hypothetical protein
MQSMKKTDMMKQISKDLSGLKGQMLYGCLRTSDGGIKIMIKPEQ